MYRSGSRVPQPMSSTTALSSQAKSRYALDMSIPPTASGRTYSKTQGCPRPRSTSFIARVLGRGTGPRQRFASRFSSLGGRLHLITLERAAEVDKFDRYPQSYSEAHAASVQASGEGPEYFARHKLQCLA